MVSLQAGGFGYRFKIRHRVRDGSYEQAIETQNAKLITLWRVTAPKGGSARQANEFITAY